MENSREYSTTSPATHSRPVTIPGTQRRHLSGRGRKPSSLRSTNSVDMRGTKSDWILVAALASVPVMLVWAMWADLTYPTPTMYVSWTTKKCVRVLQEGKDLPCHPTPPKFHRVWVK